MTPPLRGAYHGSSAQLCAILVMTALVMPLGALVVAPD
jgi:hypothetical protein